MAHTTAAASFVRPISPSLPQPLVWHRPVGWRGVYELRAAGEVVATIRHHGLVRPVAVAECRDGCWEFVLEGWLRSRIMIRACSTGEDVAVFRRRRVRGGGAVAFPNGTNYEARTRFRPLDLEFRLREGTPAFLAFKAARLLRRQVAVDIAPSAASIHDLPMLVCFGCYVLLNLESSVALATID